MDRFIPIYGPYLGMKEFPELKEGPGGACWTMQQANHAMARSQKTN